MMDPVISFRISCTRTLVRPKETLTGSPHPSGGSACCWPWGTFLRFRPATGSGIPLSPSAAVRATASSISLFSRKITDGSAPPEKLMVTSQPTVWSRGGSSSEPSVHTTSLPNCPPIAVANRPSDWRTISRKVSFNSDGSVESTPAAVRMR